jgi:hypothetical protein
VSSVCPAYHAGVDIGALMTAAVVLADPANTNPFTGFNYLAPILSTGIVGLLFLMLLFRVKIMPTYVYDDYKVEKEKEIARLDKENDDLKEANSALRTLTEQQIIPALVRANQLSADYAQDLAAERRGQHGGS